MDVILMVTFVITLFVMLNGGSKIDKIILEFSNDSTQYKNTCIALIVLALITFIVLYGNNYNNEVVMGTTVMHKA